MKAALVALVWLVALASAGAQPGPARAVVHGVLVAQWAGAPGQRQPLFVLYLAPESARALQPHTGTPLQAVQLQQGGAAALVALASPAVAAAFLRDDGSSVAAEGLLVLQGLALGSACGPAWARADALEADPVRLLRGSPALPVPDCAWR